MYNNDEIALIWLDLIDGLTYKKKEKLLSVISSPAAIKDNFVKLKDKIIDAVGDKIYIEMQQTLKDKSLDKHLACLEKQKVVAVTKFSSNYPEKLKSVEMPPFILYCIGDTGLLSSNCFAVVGTRKMTNYGRQVTEKFSKDLCKAGFVIVSGLATGVDTIAHESALEYGGKTIAVLAGGFDEIYPPTNFNLSKQIEQKGLLISEFKPSEKSESYYFPIRNRIIAALSQGVLITEADEKSGAMHTKNYAIDNGIDVYAIPGSILSPTSRGTNNLIKLGHAICVTEINDVLINFNMQLSMDIVPKILLGSSEKLIVDILKTGELSYDEILFKTKIDVKNLNSLLTTLSIRGIIKKLAGNIYTL